MFYIDVVSLRRLFRCGWKIYFQRAVKQCTAYAGFLSKKLAA